MTRSEHFEVLPEEIRQKAIANMEAQGEIRKLKKHCYNENALIMAFAWFNAKEKYDFWYEINQKYFSK